MANVNNNAPRCEAARNVLLTAGKVATDTDGLRWSSRLIQRIVDIVVLVFGAAGKALSALGTAAGGLASLVEFVEPIKRSYQILKAAGREVVSWAEVTALSFTLVYRTLTAVKFLHDIGVPHLAGFAATLGSYYVLSPISFVGNIFDITANSISLHKNPRERELAEAGKAFAELKARAIGNLDGAVAVTEQQYNAAAERLLRARNNVVASIGTRDVRIKQANADLGLQLRLNNQHDIGKTWAAFTTAVLNHHRNAAAVEMHRNGDVRADTEFLRSKTVTDITFWNKNVENSEINKRKGVIAIVSAITKIAIIVLASIGSWCAVSALVFNAPICIAVGFVVAAVAVAKVIYNRKHDEEAMKAKEFVYTPTMVALVNRQLLAAV